MPVLGHPIVAVEMMVVSRKSQTHTGLTLLFGLAPSIASYSVSRISFGFYFSIQHVISYGVLRFYNACNTMMDTFLLDEHHTHNLRYSSFYGAYLLYRLM